MYAVARSLARSSVSKRDRKKSEASGGDAMDERARAQSRWEKGRADACSRASIEELRARPHMRLCWGDPGEGDSAGGKENEPDGVATRCLVQTADEGIEGPKVESDRPSAHGLDGALSSNGEDLLHPLLIDRLHPSRLGPQPQVPIKRQQHNLCRLLFLLRPQPIAHAQDPRSVHEMLLLEPTRPQDEVIHIPRPLPQLTTVHRRRAGAREGDVLGPDGKVREVVSSRGLDFERTGVRADVDGEVGEGRGLIGETVELGDDGEGDHSRPASGFDESGEEGERGEENVGVEDKDGVTGDDVREILVGGGGFGRPRVSEGR
jgi:hypothetical protein